MPIGINRAARISQISDGDGTTIPDTLVQLHDARELTGVSDGGAVSTYTAQVGTDLTGTGTYRASAINSQASIEIDSADDGFDATINNISQPYTVYAVVDPDFAASVGEDRAAAADPAGGDSPVLQWQGRNSNWQFYAGNPSLTGSGTADRRLVSAFIDGASSLLREDGSQTAAADAGLQSLQLLSIGRHGSAKHFGGDVPYVEVHDGAPSNGFEIREQEIIDDWGFSF